MEDGAMTKEATQELATIEHKVELVMPSTEALGKLNGMTPGYKLTAEYRKQEDWYTLKDKPVNCFFMGMKEIPNDKGEMIMCAVFAAQDGVFMAAQMVLVEAVRHLEPRTPIRITFKGKKPNKNSDGSTNLFDVQILG